MYEDSDGEVDDYFSDPDLENEDQDLDTDDDYEDPLRSEDQVECDKLLVSHIHADEVVNEMNREIEKAKSVIERSYTSTRLLLAAYDWDAQKCIDHYFAEQSKQQQNSCDSNNTNQLHSPRSTVEVPPLNDVVNKSVPVSVSSLIRRPFNSKQHNTFGVDVAQSPQDSFLLNLHKGQVLSPLTNQLNHKDDLLVKECLICLSEIHPCQPKSNCPCGAFTLNHSNRDPDDLDPDPLDPSSVTLTTPKLCAPSSDSMRIRGCLHLFCKECVIKYLKTKIVDVGRADRVLCPEEDCKNVIDDEIIIELLEQCPKAVRQYKQLMANGYIQKNRLMRWCPSPECCYALRADQCIMKRAQCKCGKVICFKCGRDWHDPIQCDLLEKWMLKYTTDSENAQYIVANTKPCPNTKCKVSIEKNGGCNHMICKSCNHNFCWMCLEPWEKHGQNWYNCTRFDEDSSLAQSLQKTRERLRRFVHYGGRYDLHTSSLRKIPELRELIKEKVLSMTNDCRLSYVDTKFLEPAVEVLKECRNVLSYTYAFAYYLAPNNQKSILEDNQKDLEIVTEDLTAALERDLAEDPFTGNNDATEYKCKVQNHTTYCERRAMKLLEHVKEGYENQLWDYDKSLVDEKVLPG